MTESLLIHYMADGSMQVTALDETGKLRDTPALMSCDDITGKYNSAHATLMIDSALLHNARIALPGNNRQRQIKAAPYALEDQLACDIDDLHFILGKREADNLIAVTCRLPVPAPATAELLKGMPTAGGPVDVELTTPTGAAILTTLAEPSVPWPAMCVEAVGYGAGSRDLAELPNLPRLAVGTSAGVGPGFLGASETLNMLMQQHNLKEENMLYPMSDNSLGADNEAVIHSMQAVGR